MLTCAPLVDADGKTTHVYTTPEPPGAYERVALIPPEAGGGLCEKRLAFGINRSVPRALVLCDRFFDNPLTDLAVDPPGREATLDARHRYAAGFLLHEWFHMLDQRCNDFRHSELRDAANLESRSRYQVPTQRRPVEWSPLSVRRSHDQVRPSRVPERAHCRSPNLTDKSWQQPISAKTSQYENAIDQCSSEHDYPLYALLKRFGKPPQKDRFLKPDVWVATSSEALDASRS